MLRLPVAVVRIFAALLWASQGDAPIEVTFTTRDGNSVTGTTELRAVKIESSVGTREVKLELLQLVNLSSSVAWIRAPDGTTIFGKITPDVWKFKTKLGEVTLKAEKLATVEIHANKGASPPESKPPTAPSDPFAKGLQPYQSLLLSGSPNAPCLSSDRKRIYALVFSEPDVFVVDTETMALEGKIPVGQGVRLLSSSADGKSLVAAGGQTLRVIDTVSRRVSQSIELEDEIYAVHVLDEQTLYVVVKGVGLYEFLVLSIPKRSVVQRVPLDSTPCLAIRPISQGGRVYVSGGSLLFPGKGKSPVIGKFLDPSYSMSRFVLSPDERAIVDGAGRVRRLSEDPQADLALMATIEPPISAFFADHGKLLMTVDSRLLRTYETATWKVTKELAIGIIMSWGALDETSGMLYVAGRRSPKQGLFKVVLPR
jgi:hypothetical protein